MKKSLFRPARTGLAMALLAGVAATSHAQSSVQLYGLMDASAGRFQAAGAASTNAVASGNMSTSHIGFKGTEDLGGGLSAKFAAEHFLRLDTGEAGRFNGDAFWARNAYVGLTSTSLGSVTLGRNTTSMFVSTLLFNAFGDSFGFSPSIRHWFTAGTLTGDSGWGDSVSYTTPSMSGLTGQLQVAGGEGNGGRNVGGNVLYFSGKFAATLAAQNVKKGATVADTTAWQLGASYDLGWAKLFGQGGQVDNKTTNVTYKLLEAGVSVPMGSGKWMAQGGYMKPDTGNKRATLSLGYSHNLSKRTELYSVYMFDKAANLTNGNTYAVGVRHKF